MSPYVWLAIAGVMALIEIFSLSLITAWFVVGALAAFLVGILGGNIVMQLVVFLVVSVACLVFLRPLFIRYRKKGESEEASYVGQTAVVCEDIDNEKLVGRVETANKMTWAAKSADGMPLKSGQVVTVVDQESIKLIVERKAD